jgi:hypothetical protein
MDYMQLLMMLSPILCFRLFVYVVGLMLGLLRFWSFTAHTIQRAYTHCELQEDCTYAAA